MRNVASLGFSEFCHGIWILYEKKLNLWSCVHRMKKLVLSCVALFGLVSQALNFYAPAQMVSKILGRRLGLFCCTMHEKSIFIGQGQCLCGPSMFIKVCMILGFRVVQNFHVLTILLWVR